jgi:hypothetical protein
MMPDLTNMLAWWQWTILAAVPPAIVLLYFLKLRRRPLQVPSTYLWHKSIEDVHVNTIWQRLRRNVLLLLQLLLILLAAVALVRPHWQAMQLSGKRFILLIDNSASMQASDVKPSRLEEAKRRATELIDQMTSGDVAMIISFADTARVEQSFTDNRRRLRESLAAIRPTQRPTSLLEALKVASGLANPGRSAEDISDVRVAEAMPAKLVIFSDGKFGPVAGFELGHLEPVFVPIGDPAAANVGIMAFSVGRQEGRPDRLQAFARLENFGKETVSVKAELFRDDRWIDEEHPEIAAGETRGLAFDLATADEGTLRLRVSCDGDQLACDNEAYAVLNPPRRAKVLLVTTGDEPLEMALATKPAGELAEVRTEGPAFLKTKTYLDLAAGGAFDFIIYDRCRPPQMPRANTLFVGSLPPEGGWTAKAKTAMPQIIDTEVSHPLLQWIDMGDVILAEGTPLGVPRGGRTLIDTDAGPILAVAPRDSFEDVVMGFVLIDEIADAGGKTQRFIGANWPIRVSFSSFVLNSLTYLGGRSQTAESGLLRPGSAVTLESPDAKATVTIRSPTGKTTSLPHDPLGKYTFTDADDLGLYEAQANGKTFQRFAVNLFDAAESDIRPDANPAIKIGYVQVAGQTGWESGHREIWKQLLLLGLAVSLLEWYIYSRRVSY